MKTLYINLNNEQIQSNDELVVLKHDLDSDFLFYLGGKIAKGCVLENEKALITSFNTQENEEDYKQIIAQWNEIKTILFSDGREGKFEFTLPNGYIHWLKFHPQYVSIYDKNFSHGESNVISIDLEELYEESIEDMQREILRKLKRDDLHKEIDEIVFNDDGVSRNSPNVCIITEKYKNIKFKSCKKYKLREFCTFDDDVLKNKEQNDGTLDIAPEISIEKRIEIAKSFPLDWQLLFYRISFLRTSDFSDGLASIKLNNKYGFIDKTGNSVIPCIYDGADSFSEGLAPVKLNNKWGVIDKTGELVIPCIYDNINKFCEGLAKVELNNKWGFIDKAGNTVIPCIYNYDYKNYDITWHNRCFFIHSFSDGLAMVVLNKLKQKYGFIDKTGEIAIPFIYDGAGSFSEGLAYVYLNNKYGFIDKTGKSVIPCIYDRAGDFSEGLAYVYLNNKWGFLTKLENWLYLVYMMKQTLFPKA